MRTQEHIRTHNTTVIQHTSAAVPYSISHAMRTITLHHALLFFAYLPFFMVTAATTELEDMFERMETDTLQLAKYMETLLLQNDKCSAENIQKCSEANYDGCVSEFPSMDCPGEDFSYPIGQCGSSKEGGCGGFFDFTVSQVTLAPSIRTDLGDEEANVKDTVCWTLLAEQEMIDVSSSSKDYWNKYSVSSPALFFGADNGVFRQYPACESLVRAFVLDIYLIRIHSSFSFVYLMFIACMLYYLSQRGILVKMIIHLLIQG